MGAARVAGRMEARQVAEGQPGGRLLARLAVVVLVAGLALRALAPFAMDVWEDGGEYVAMGHAWAREGAFVLPYGEDRGPSSPTGEPGHSHHYPPMWPLLLGLVYRAAGFGLAQTKVALALASLATVAVVHLATRDLYGPRVALMTSALVAVEPHLVWATGRGYSENLALAFFALTLWAILRSLRDERFVVLAGLFAALAYLTRSSMGPFFLVAGFAGLAWRLRHRGAARTFGSRHYLAAAGVFGAGVGAWSWRNLSLFGWPHWQTSAYLQHATSYALAHPALLLQGLALKGLFFGGLLALYALPFLPQLREAWRRRGEEDASALLLALGLVFLLAWWLTALLWPLESHVSWLFPEHHRYVVVALVPLAWLALRGMRPDREALLRWGAAAVVLLLASTAVTLGPMRDSEARAAEWLRPHLREGDRVGLWFLSTYEPYPFLAGTGVTLYQRHMVDEPEFVLARVPHEEEGYVVVAQVHQNVLLKEDRPAFVLAREDVAQARGLPQGVIVRAW